MTYQQEAQINEAAAKVGVDANALKSMIVFVAEKIKETPALSEIAKNGTEAEKTAMIAAGVQSFHRQSKAIMLEVLADKTPRAKQIRRQIAADVYSSATR